jgi:hypothetical protein
MLELQGGLPTGLEALRPSEPRYSPDKATPIYYTKNGSFASGSSKMWCVSSHFHRRGGGICRAVGELHRLGEVSLAPSGGRSAKWSGLHRLSPPPWPSTPRVDMCPRSHGPNRHKTWPWGLAHLVHVSNIPRGDDDFDIWSTLLYHPLKCSNLVPKFLKSNKH